MKNIIILLLVLFGVCHPSHGQSAFQIKPFADKGHFIYPPHSKLKHHCKKTTVKESCRYQYVYIDSLKMTKGDYYSVLKLLNNATYFTSKYGIDDICFDTECFGCDKETKGKTKLSFKKKIRKPNSKTTTKLQIELNNKIANHSIATQSKICDIITDSIGNFCKIKYSYDQKAFLLQIDYGSIIDGKTEPEIRDRFFEIAKDLLIEFQKREGKGSIEKFGWPTSISQDIVEKVFELIPIPNQSSLLRYLAQIDHDKSFVLLNPKIKLKVDAVEKVKDGSNWYFNLLGTTIVTINRDNEGRIIQNPFHNFQVKGVPDNTAVDNPDGDPDIIHQASIEDVQLSETLRDKPFIFVYQNSFKANTKQLPVSNAVCKGTLDDRLECNSILVHYSDLSKFAEKNGDLSLTNAEYISSFGFRNLITPVIDIMINGNFIQCPLGISLNQLRNQMAIPASFKFYRFWNGKFVKHNSKNLNKLILLPNDKIIF